MVSNWAVHWDVNSVLWRACCLANCLDLQMGSGWETQKDSCWGRYSDSVMALHWAGRLVVCWGMTMDRDLEQTRVQRTAPQMGQYLEPKTA